MTGGVAAMQPQVGGENGQSSQSTPSRRLSLKTPPPEKEAFVRDWPQLSLSASSADYYFNSYNHYGVHEDVLKDTSTSEAFVRAVTQNAHLFQGKVVLDVCAGLGVCSLLAAKAGARRVIALESQQELAQMAEAVARRNGFGPDVIEVVCGSADALERLPEGVESVDIIISQWLGYFLMYESRLAEVLRARDRWLRPGGLMFPDRAKLYVAALEDAAYVERHFDYYRNVWGFDFSAMDAAARGEPVVSLFLEEQLISSPGCVLDLDLRTCTAADCFHMASTFQLNCRRAGAVHALLAWFEVRFEACHKPVAFATGPQSPQTCWKQTAFFLGGEPLAVRQGDRVRGMIAVRQGSEKRRSLDIKVSCRVNAGTPRVQLCRWS